MKYVIYLWINNEIGNYCVEIKIDLLCFRDSVIDFWSYFIMNKLFEAWFNVDSDLNTNSAIFYEYLSVKKQIILEILWGRNCLQATSDWKVVGVLCNKIKFFIPRWLNEKAVFFNWLSCLKSKIERSCINSFLVDPMIFK